MTPQMIENSSSSTFEFPLVVLGRQIETKNMYPNCGYSDQLFGFILPTSCPAFDACGKLKKIIF